jgi:hypothetical protein
MCHYLIIRRARFQTVEQLQDAAVRSTRVSNEEMPEHIRWIRTYVLD